VAERNHDQDEHRSCPTRTTGAAPLIVQWITPATCLERQRRNYHKCFTCFFRGAGVMELRPMPIVPPMPRRERPPLDAAP